MTDTLTPAAAFSALKLCYDEFCEKSQALGQQSGVRDLLSGLMGEGPVKRAQGALLTEMVETVQGHVAALLAAIEPCTPEERSQWAVHALEQMLLTPPTGDRNLDFMLAALEGQAEPLIPLVDRETLADLAARYQKRTPKRMMFPNQKKVLQALQAGR